MSWAATAFVKKIRTAPNGKPILKAQKLLLFVIADYHNEERGDAWASLAHLAVESMYTKSALVRAIRKLERMGILHIIRDPAAKKTRVTNRYQFYGLDAIATDSTGTVIHKTIHRGSDPRSLGVVTPGHQASDPRSLGVVTPGHYIFPKNLSNQSLQKKEGAHALVRKEANPRPVMATQETAQARDSVSLHEAFADRPELLDMLQRMVPGIGTLGCHSP